jgi:hypothetical protein
MNQILPILFVLAPILTHGQNLVTGRVVDIDSKKPVKEATVVIDGSNVQTVTNFLGYFQIAADTSKTLVVKCNGYETGQVKVPNAKGFQIQLTRDLTPGFPNNISDFYKYLGQNARYPDEAWLANKEGRVYISFDVDSVQGIQNIKIIKDIGYTCGKHIVKLLKNAPANWRAKSKSITLILPVTFRMGLSDLGQTGENIKLPAGKLLSEINIARTPRK